MSRVWENAVRTGVVWGDVETSELSNVSALGLLSLNLEGREGQEARPLMVSSTT